MKTLYYRIPPVQTGGGSPIDPDLEHRRNRIDKWTRQQRPPIPAEKIQKTLEQTAQDMHRHSFQVPGDPTSAGRLARKLFFGK